MMGNKKTRSVIAAGLMAGLCSFTNAAHAQGLDALGCVKVEQSEDAYQTYKDQFVLTYAEEKSLLEVSRLSAIFDVVVNDCRNLAIILLEPKDSVNGTKETWVFSKEPWTLISN